MRRAASLFALATLLLSCGRPKTEEEKLADSMSSWRCRSYRFTSEKLTRTVVTQIEKTGTDEVSTPDVHAILSILWFTQKKSEYCYIEADILEGLPTEYEYHDVSLGLKALALHGMGLPQLSRAQYEKLKSSLGVASGKTPAEVQLEHKIYLLVLVLVGFHQGDPALTKFGAETLGAIAELDYLAPLVGVAVESKEGNIARALEDINELRNSERFKEHTQVLIGEIAEIIENSDSGERLTEDILERITALLAQRVLEDIFAEEGKKGLLDRVRQLPEAITGDADESEQIRDLEETNDVEHKFEPIGDRM